MVVGRIRKNTGNVPIRIGRSGSFRMPHNTLVGQSGPPTSNAHLAHNAPRCVRCKVRYCDSTCQHDHWRRGHKQMCKKIHRGGNAEQYNADKKYKEAVAVAVEACAEDTKGQTCFICTQALHWKTKEGLVRGCACRGTAGFAHVSCLAEQVKILVAEAEENNLDKVVDERFGRWRACSLCEQDYHGVVCHALGWACWKTYVGRPETDQLRSVAMGRLGAGLSAADHNEDALSVKEAQLSMLRRIGAPETVILNTQGNLAIAYGLLGQHERALQMKRDIYSGRLVLFGEEDENTIRMAYTLANSLRLLQRFDEAKSLLLKVTPLDDLREAVETLEDIERTARRVLGGAHPLTSGIKSELQKARAALRARETPSPGSA
ncbi:unnamed protein product [Pelagomonas calceolata]|uniref:RING-CH-type domain-containing protein n=1 Tax=Pelagomonas calceolata TaxID=35677 RepID=A0A8J2SH99_9STRA|nr:unnamed protein product [Pelagomonas calceolata]